MTTGISTLPLPHWDDSTVVVEPPGDEPGAWSGAPSSIVADGDVYLAYRLRLPIGAGRGISNVVARSRDGVSFTVVAEVSIGLRGGVGRMIIEYAQSAGGDPAKPWAPIFGAIAVGLVAAGAVGLIGLLLRPYRRGETA